MTKGLKSPAEAGAEDIEQEEVEKDLQGFDPDFLDVDEIGEIPESAERTPHPFAGYPLGRKIKLKGSQGDGISSTFIVILKDKESVFQDPSGKGVDHEFFAKDNQGNDIKATDADGRFKPAKVASRKVINLKSYHNRVTTNPNGGESVDSVFDRIVTVKNRGEMYCAIVPDPVHRAMICFNVDKKGKMRRDTRYLLADINQKNRLRDVFRMVHYQQMKAERLSQKHYSDPGDQEE